MLLGRAGLKRHKRGLTDDQVARARKLYESGLSLVEVGADLKVNGSTIQNSFRRAASRPGHGGVPATMAKRRSCGQGHSPGEGRSRIFLLCTLGASFAATRRW